MNFTEEEFYGNSQGTVLENGEVSYAKNDQQQQENSQNSNLVVSVLTTFLKTLSILLGLVFYVVSVMVSLSPQTAIKMFDYVKLDKASLFCYERIYKKEQTLSSLYNLVQKSIENKDYEKSSKYIQELQGKSDYVDFCVKVNAATLKVIDKKYIAYVGDLDSYLVSQKIIAEYGAGNKQKALSIALSDLYNQNVYSFGISSYFECLDNDKSLPSEEVDFKILSIINTNFEDSSVLDLIKQRKEFLNSNEDDSNGERILNVYTKLKIEKVLYRIYKISNQTELKEETQENILSLQNEYNSLIG